MKKRSMSLFLAVVLTLSLAVPGLAVGAYTDTEGHWAAEAVERWSAKGVLQGSDGAFRPDDTITRAEMAVILDRLMVYITVAKNTFTDVQDGAWYTEALLGASAAGIMKGDGATMRPSASLTRQEAIVLLGRALGVKEDVAAISVFTDAAAVADWAKGYVGGMSAAGIIKGADGRVNPTASITRAEVVTIMDNAVSAVYAAAGTYTEDAAGNVIVSAPGVVLKNMTIRGNLIVAEGVGTGECTLDGVTVKGRAIVRGGGEHSIIIKGDSDIAEISIEQRDNNLRVAVQGDANVAIIVINDGKNDVLIEGNVGEVTLTTASAVTVTGTVKELIVAESAASADLIVAKTAKVETLTVAAEDTTVTVAGSVAKVDVAASATATSLSVEKGATVKTITTAADDVSLGGSGKVEKLTVTDGTGTTVSKDTTVTKVDNKSDEPVDVGGKDIPAGGTGSSSGNTGSTGGGGGNGGNGGTTTSTTVTDKAGLEAALANAQYSTITIDGIIGATSAYEVIEVKRAVTIRGGTVNGTFNVLTDGVTLSGITVNSRGGGGDSLKNAINVVAKTVTITGCTLNLALTTNDSGVGNAIVVYPYGSSTTANYVISGNTINGYAVTSDGWGSSGIAITEGYALMERFKIDGTSAVVAIDDRAIATGNTYRNTTNEYVHTDWTVGDNSGKYKFGYFEDGYSDNYATGATMLLGGTVGSDSEYGILILDRAVTIKGVNTGSAQATVYGSFVVTAENVAFDNLAIHNKYTVVNESASKNAINAYTDSLTVTNCTFTAETPVVSGGEPNGLMIFPKSAAGSYTVTGNTFTGYQAATTDGLYHSAGYFVAEGYPMEKKPFFNATGSSFELDNAKDAETAAANTYKDCAYGYVRMSGFDWGKPAVGQTVEYAVVCNEAALKNAVEYAAKNATIKLGADMTVSADTLPKLTDTLVFDLNGKTMTLSGQNTLTLSKQDETPVSVTFKNGILVANNAQATKANIAIESGCSIVLDDVTVTATGTVLYPRGTAAAVTVCDSSITTTGVYAIATNAEAPENGGVVITVENASLTTKATDKDSCALLINVPGTLTVKNAEITGQRQAVVVRSGTASFTDCTITSAFTEMTWKTDYYTGKWGSGDEVPYGAVVVGKDSTAAYAGDIALNLSGCTISCTYVGNVPDTYGRYASAVYAIDNNSADGYDVTITVENCTVKAGNVVNYKTAPAVIKGNFSDSEDKIITPMDDIPALVSAVSETEAVAEAEPEADAEMGTEAEPKAEAEADTTTIPSEE